MALASHPVGGFTAAGAVVSRNSCPGVVAACCENFDRRSTGGNNDLSFSSSVRSHSSVESASSSSSLHIIGAPVSSSRNHGTSLISSGNVASSYSRSARYPSLSLKDSDASPSEASDERKSFVSSPNLQTGKTPSGGQNNMSFAEQLQLSSGDISSSSTEAVETPGTSSITSKREKSPRYTVDRWAPQGSKYHRVSDILQKLKDAESTDEAVERALENCDDSLSPRDICAVLSGLKWRKALAFFRWAKSKQFELNIVVYNVLLGTMRAGRQWKIADEFAMGMVKEGVELDNYTYSTLISCALQCKAPRDALTWFDRAGKYQKASAVIKEMKEFGPDAVVYNTLIKHFAREGKTGQAKGVFKEMESNGIKATEFTLSLMIDVHRRSGNVADAFALFARMKEEKLPLDTAVYNSLLKMCGEERRVVEGEHLITEMTERGLTPDEVTYKSLVNLYAKVGRIDEAVKAMQEMIEAGCPADVVVYSCLIKACGATQQFETAEKFYEEMLASGNTVDDRCCGVLLSLVNMCETDEERAPVLRCLQTAKPTLYGAVNVLLSETVDSGELEGQVRTLIAESGSDSRRPFCNSLIDLCWSLGYKDRAESLLALAEYLKVYPGNLVTHTNRLWILHLRSLSFNTAHCALAVWIDFLRSQIAEGQNLPESLVIETGAGRNRGGDGARLITVILSELKEMNSPFETSPRRADWLVASGSSVTTWISSGSEPVQDKEKSPSDA